MGEIKTEQTLPPQVPESLDRAIESALRASVIDNRTSIREVTSREILQGVPANYQGPLRGTHSAVSDQGLDHHRHASPVIGAGSNGIPSTLPPQLQVTTMPGGLNPFNGEATIHAAPRVEILVTSPQGASASTFFQSTGATLQREAAPAQAVATETRNTPLPARAEKTERASELQRPEISQENKIVNLSHKDIAQALEAALAKAIPASSEKVSVVEHRLSPAVPTESTTSSGVSTQHISTGDRDGQQLSNSERKSAPIALEITLPISERASPHALGADTSPLTRPGHIDPLHLTAQPLQHDKNLHSQNLSEVSAGAASKPSLDNHQAPQTHELNRNRIEQIIVAQQMLAVDSLLPPIARVTDSPSPVLNAHPRHESTTIALEQLRESVLDKIITIQTQIQSSLTRQERCESVAPTVDMFIQGRGDLLKADPIYHGVKPYTHLRHADRSGDTHHNTKSILESSPSWSHVVPGMGLSSASPHVSAALRDPVNLALRALLGFTQKSVNFQLIKKMDSPLERACLALVTGAAMGVLGIDIMLRTTKMALKEIRGLLRDSEEGSDAEANEESLLRNLYVSLQEALIDEPISLAERGVVADISGMLICAATGAPIEGVLVSSLELGASVTNTDGRFLFSNVKIGTAYGVRFYKSLYSLNPNSISGTCGYDSHHNVRIVLTPLTP